MTFEEFLEHCSFDFSETDRADQTQIVVIFSEGFMTYHNSEFVDNCREVAKTLVAHNLYDYLTKEFNNG